ncbi:5-oxoprolinase subunit PxpB [bacterium]|nr:MAG: 5-oxoprolinase subunit PxpB [bacterium]
MGENISEATSRSVTGLNRQLQNNRFPGMIETVAAYCSLAVFFDPLVITYEEALCEIRKAETMTSEPVRVKERVIDIPVAYGGEYGPDLKYLAGLKGISAEEIIKLHTGVKYTVGMIGFSPGFPYLIGLPKKLAAPRKQTPRQKIPAGSVGIAGQQTGIYPAETPGGWQIIGRTPLKLFNIHRSEPFLLQAGDRVIFRPVSPGEFNGLSKGENTYADG